MPITMYYRAPDMSRGMSLGEYDSSREAMKEILGSGVNLPDDTLIYYREQFAGKAFIIRGGQALQIWSPKIQRRDGITMAQAMAAAPNLTTEELRELLS